MTGASYLVKVSEPEAPPSGQPENVTLKPISQTSLLATWYSPIQFEWNGNILGFYVGYKVSNPNSPYAFEVVEEVGKEGNEYSLELKNLKEYTQYSVVVQAYNQFGAGPMSDTKTQYTDDGTPNLPPSDVQCTTHNSQGIRVSWVSPPLESVNGVIKHYKVIYAPSDLWLGGNNSEIITNDTDLVLTQLKANTNYKIEVLAATSKGDGVRSEAIQCQTEQDLEVPAALIEVKALVSGPQSILVSWRSPSPSNSIVSHYTVYSHEQNAADSEARIQKVPWTQTDLNVLGLKQNQPYKFWVTAGTFLREGDPSKRITAIPSDQIPTKIATFERKFVAPLGHDIMLPCLSVGSPTPNITWWKVWTIDLNSLNDQV